MSDGPTSEGQPEQPRQGKGRLKSALFNLVLLAGSGIFTLALAEVAVRIVRPQELVVIRPDMWMGIDTLGWYRRPNVDTHINTGERTVRFVTDAEGFRVGLEGRRTRPDSVLVIGDSFMEALQVEYEQSLSGLIEDSLRGPDGQRVAVRNAGTGGWGPSQYLLFAERQLAARRYSLLLVAVFVGNDVVQQPRDYFPPRQPTERGRFSIPFSLSPSAWIDGVARPLNDILEVRSHLFVLAKNATAPLRIRLGLSAAYVPRGVRVENADGPEWGVTADLMTRLARLAEERETPSLFVLIPERYQVNAELFEQHMASYGLDESAIDLDQPNRRLEAEFEARGLNFVDLLDVFRASHEAGESPLFGSVDPHLSPAGHQKVFEVLRPLMSDIMWGS